MDAFGGALVFSQRKARRVVRVGLDGGPPEVVRTISDTALEPAGNAFREPILFTGLVASAPGVGGAILQTSLDGDAGPSLPLADGINAADLVVTPSGAIFFTAPRPLVPNDQALGLFRLAPDGGAAVPETSLFGHVHGVTLSASGSNLAAAMIDDKSIARLVLASDGTVLGPASPLAWKTTDHPVAVATDQVGNVWMAETTDLGSTQSGRVEVRSRLGEPLGVIPFPSERPTGVAFGGSTDTTVFITTETGIFVYESLCPGVR